MSLLHLRDLCMAWFDFNFLNDSALIQHKSLSSDGRNFHNTSHNKLAFRNE